MKKLIALILCLMLCLPAASAFAESEEREVLTAGSFSYVVLNDGTAEIVKYTGNGEKPTIPERLDGWKVTSMWTERRIPGWRSGNMLHISIHIT